MLQHALGLQGVQVSSEHTIHGLELSDLFIAKASCAHTDSEAEGTQTVFLDVFLRIVVFEATHAVFPPADILVIWINNKIRILA